MLQLRRLKAAARRLARYRHVFTGRPLVFRTRRHVVKTVFRRVAARHLAHEVANTHRAKTWAPFADAVVVQDLVTPFMAVSQRRHTDSSRDETVAAMVRFIARHLAEAKDARRATAHDLIRAHMANLRIVTSRRPELLARLQAVLESGFFDFTVPQTPMHGDFLPGNALLQRDELVLVDWEYASEDGSVLYDVWFLRRSLRLHQAHTSFLLSQVRLLDDALLTHVREFAMTLDQVDGFGNAMHAVVDFSRFDTRSDGDQVLTSSVLEVERLARSSSAS